MGLCVEDIKICNEEKYNENKVSIPIVDEEAITESDQELILSLKNIGESKG